MSDLTIEHDPDSGCEGCPLFAEDCGHDFCATLGSLVALPGRHWWIAAPDECPLRTARVVVQRPEGES